MSTNVCLRFKQNAWKKDFCSNCYRLKEEHKTKVNSIKSFLHLPLKEASQGILNIGDNKKSKNKKSVRFTKEESEIIGYSGGETDIEDDDDFFGIEEFLLNNVPEKENSVEDEKALEKLTKTNTNFNSVSENLNTKPLILNVKSEVILEPKNEENEIKNQSEISTDIKISPNTDNIKTIVISGKKEERGNPEGRKTQITRGSVITKTHEQAKNKLYIQNIQKTEKRNSTLDTKNDKDNINTITIKCQIEEKNEKNVQEYETNKPEKEEVTVEVLKLLNGKNGLPESREMAGEPDGKADNDETEVHITPPPRSSFLHRENNYSPPKTPPSDKSPPNWSQITPPSDKLPNWSQITPPKTPPSPEKIIQPNWSPRPQSLCLISEPQEQTETYRSLTPTIQESVKCKRMAPKPPISNTPEPLPRRRNSQEVIQTLNEKKKKVRQTLKKFLWFTNKDEECGKYENIYIPPRPRPQIIHPLDLNKSAVQVLPAQSPDSSPSSPTNPCPARPSKPPPPPRSESLNLLERLRPTPSQDNLYENLGEGRCSIVPPTKPQRSGSVRLNKISCDPDNDDLYEQIDINRGINETSEDSDIYYPYMSFERDKNKLERGIVHSTIEENYGAVVVANLDALTNILTQVKTHEIPQFLKDLKQLSWNSFTIEDKPVITINEFKFVEAIIENNSTTLAVTNVDLMLPNFLNSIIFKDSQTGLFQNSTQCSVFVLERIKIKNINDYLENREKSPEGIREGALIILKILKFLNKGKTNVNLNNFIVFSPINDETTQTPLYIPATKEESSDREAILSFINKLFKDLPLEKILIKCDLKEMQDVLQVWLWGPTKMLQNTTLQRWLDLERAKVLQSLVCSTPSIPQREHLSFLVHASTNSILKALKVLHFS